MGPEGIRGKDDIHEFSTAWTGINAVVDSGTYLYLFYDPQSAYVIPKGPFPSQDDAQAFLQLALVYWKAVKASGQV